MENDLDAAVNDIISQLKNTSNLVKTTQRVEDTLDKEKLEEFIIQKSGSLITKTLDIVDEVQNYISTAPDAKDVAAFAELLKAASSSIEALNKVYISVEKNKTAKDIKRMDIDSKERMNTQDNVTYLVSRKEIIAGLIERSKDPEQLEMRDVTPVD